MIAASIFLPSHNKPEYVMDAIYSVLAQTFTDWECWLMENSTDGETREVIANSGVLSDARIRYEEIDLTESERRDSYATALLMNRYYPQANGEIMFFLADDDLLDSKCVATCIEYFEQHPFDDVAYFSLALVGVDGPDADPDLKFVYDASKVRVSGEIDNKVDSGQVAHRKRALYAIDQPYLPLSADHRYARHVDGLFLEKLAAVFDFHPIPKILAIKRCTPISTWTQYHNGSRRIANVE